MTVVAARNLSKRFMVPTAGGPKSAYGYRTLRDEISRWAGRLVRRAPDVSRREFWALRHVDFEINQGEVIGVIGRNGAGKSTLLKVLSRITKPSDGEVRLRGRVGSLLEVGTGFHPELTGRENIFLNGAILGMRREEIRRKFDAIVDFSEIAPFLDLPVKRYSSGMYVRLAFAVAAHLEPEILIVDEVLAVGDLAFQRKCLGRMHEVGRSGATVLFVSHNMPAVEALCSRAILFDQGQIVSDGPVRDLVQEYHRRVLQPQGHDGVELKGLNSPTRVQKIFQSVTLLDEQGRPTNFVPMGGSLRVRLELDAAEPITFPTVTVGLDDSIGQRVLTVQTPLNRAVLESLRGRVTLECSIERLPLAPGDYWVKLGLSAVPDEIDEVERALRFTVTAVDAFNDGRGFHRGLCVAPSEWTLRE